VVERLARFWLPGVALLGLVNVALAAASAPVLPVLNAGLGGMCLTVVGLDLLSRRRVPEMDLDDIFPTHIEPGHPLFELLEGAIRSGSTTGEFLMRKGGDEDEWQITDWHFENGDPEDPGQE
jgi:hypothetical protein